MWFYFASNSHYVKSYTEMKSWILYVTIYMDSPRHNTPVTIDAVSPLTLSPRSFCLSGSTPVKVLMDCFRSNTVSSSDRELMEYSWPPHLMITDTDMAHFGSLRTNTLCCSWMLVFKQIFPATVTNKHTYILQREGKGDSNRGCVRMPVYKT